MAHGLQIFGPSGQVWFDSTLAQAGVPIDYITVSGATYSNNTWYPGTYSKTYSTAYADMTIKALYLSNMFLEVTTSSGSGISQPTISITNNGVSDATILVIATG